MALQTNMSKVELKLRMVNFKQLIIYRRTLYEYKYAIWIFNIPASDLVNVFKKNELFVTYFPT